jgi:hypothetical protein
MKILKTIKIKRDSNNAIITTIIIIIIIIIINENQFVKINTDTSDSFLNDFT